MYQKMYHHSRIPTILGGSGGGSLLPPELQACEYLETDNNSYIQINVQANEIEYIHAITQQNTNTTNTSWFGASTSPYVLQCYHGATNKYTARVFQQTSSYITSNVKLGDELDFYLDLINKTIQFNEQTINLPTFNKNTITNKLKLFGSDVNGSFYINKCNAKIKIFETNLCNLISCYTQLGQSFIDQHGVNCPAGTPGMFDTVNGIFYTNDGTGNFTCGPDINI